MALHLDQQFTQCVFPWNKDCTAFEALTLKHLYTKYIRHSKLLQQATILVFSPQSLYGKSTTETLKLRLQLQPHVSTTFSSPFPVQLKTQSSELFKHVLKPMLP